uniref:Protein kinase domain-containing protein n=2 Tax=Pseudo-nitzschia australis TaxID=44445 RepID=A0A7S4ARX9_9STRA|mmetsp:Transcript_25376/g.54077  ORF Transcript_25376/g.54077 Transcript_25376/m.54077 type:complete len:578 (-) Transcript_25376:264-1997(-)
MSGEDRLKRRIGTSSTNNNNNNNNNNQHCPINHPSGLHNINGDHAISAVVCRSDALDFTTPSRSRIRRKRIKRRSSFWNRISFASLVRSFAVAITHTHTSCTSSTPTKGLTFPLCVAISFLLFFDNNVGTSNLRKQAARVQREMMGDDLQIVFPKMLFSGGTFSELDDLALLLDPIDTKRGLRDYGGLKIKSKGQKRRISDKDYLSETDFRPPGMKRDDDGNDAYLAFDDDYLRAVEGTNNDYASESMFCRRTSLHRLSSQNCNTIFETDFINNNVKYLNAGAYRQVFSLEHSFLQRQESIVVKDMHSGNDFAAGDFEFVRMDAMVAERLTSSPRIYDIYGFCGLSILSEFFPYGDLEDVAVTGEGYLLLKEERDRHQRNDLKSYNDIPSERKLFLSLQMAMALADLHGNQFGTIVHQDVQLSQYLLSADNTTLKLNDFNRAEFMLWNEKEGKYCKYSEGTGHGNWRSPEEYFDSDLNEQVDVFSLGNNMYSLLTGLWIFYDEDDEDNVRERIKQGEKPFIDPRYMNQSLAEAKLAEIIDRCFSFRPEDRPSIFDVVRFLSDALKEVMDSMESDEVE